jgi:hypothetical protein
MGIRTSGYPELDEIMNRKKIYKIVPLVVFTAFIVTEPMASMSLRGPVEACAVEGIGRIGIRGPQPEVIEKKNHIRALWTDGRTLDLLFRKPTVVIEYRDDDTQRVTGNPRQRDQPMRENLSDSDGLSVPEREWKYIVLCISGKVTL